MKPAASQKKKNKRFDLNKTLLDAKVPERPLAYWNNFPNAVIRKIKETFERK